MAKKKRQDDLLKEVLDAASHPQLVDFLLQLSEKRPGIRRECLESLAQKLPLPAAKKKQSEGELLLSLWSELIDDLTELDEYGGDDYDASDDVAGQLQQVAEKLDEGQIAQEYRDIILSKVLPFIDSENSGLANELYDVAYSACYHDDDFRFLARSFERMDTSWQRSHARRIYRDLGERDKYLELRRQDLKYGSDYVELAEFHWTAGEKDLAMEIAQEGLKKGEGRMDELRQFVAERLQKAGDRKGYMDLQLAITLDHMTLEKYQAFKKLCTGSEWRGYETKLLDRLAQLHVEERLKIHMHRKEHDVVVAILQKRRYPRHEWNSGYELKTAKSLEKEFPEEILTYYLSGFGHMNGNSDRGEYARKAAVMAKVRHQLVNIIGDKVRWMRFATKVKQDNIRRPAFQDEFAKAVIGWETL